jgi:predicted transcriptional regulator
MPESMSEYLRRDVECEGLFECIHGLTALDRETFAAVVASDSPMTVDEVADAIGRERSTAHRSIQRLQAVDLVTREQINYDQGGYYHVFSTADADEIALEMQRVLNEWYDKAAGLIEEFSDEYADATVTDPPVSE